MNTTLRTLLILLAIAPEVFATTASAQMGRQYWSLESLIARADVVVRGDIRETTRRFRRCDYKVAVREVLKGPRRNELEFSVKTADDEKFERFDQWRDAHTEFLWFLESKLPGGAPNVDNEGPMLRLDPPVPAERGYKTFSPPIFSMDFRVLKERLEILEESRIAVGILNRSNRKPIKSISITIPHAVGGKCSPPGDVNSIILPLIRVLI